MADISFTLYAIHEIDHDTFAPKKFGGNILKGLQDGYKPEEIQTTGENFGTFPITEDIETHKEEISERTGIPVNQILIQYNNG